MTMRIGLAGFQHETNTFAQGTTDLQAFEIADSWPGLLRGAEVVNGTRGMNLPIAGAIAAAADADLVPILWCAAEPAGPVADGAFDTIAQTILYEAVASCADGLYLDLHGAMVTQSHFDGEAELLVRLREALGQDFPIAVSLDLHANISPDLVALADVITIYRTYPHLDMAETGARAMHCLKQLIGGKRLYPAFRQVEFLVPLHAQCTDFDPARRLYSTAKAKSGSDAFAEIALGFTAADVPHCGPSVLAYGTTVQAAEQLADEVSMLLRQSEPEFETTLYCPGEAVRMAMSAEGPVILADVQDNPGAGGRSDTTGLLQALVDANAQRAILGLLCDPDVASMAHDSGQGARFSADLGDRVFGPPFHGAFEVLALSNGPIPYSGRMYGGGVATPGPSCRLRCCGGAEVEIVVTSQRIQCLDQSLLRHFGAKLEDFEIIAVKSTVHFRDDFQSLSDRIINVAAPGCFPCALDIEAFSNLRDGVRTARGSG